MKKAIEKEDVIELPEDDKTRIEIELAKEKDAFERRKRNTFTQEPEPDTED